MNDGIVKGLGNSRYLKSVSDFLTRYPNYEAYAAAMAAGTVLVDFNGVNEEGWYQLGTALNKANLLSDETAGAMLGLEAENPTVDDAFYSLRKDVLLSDETAAELSGTPGTPDEAFLALGTDVKKLDKKKANMSTYQFFITGKIWGN